MVVTAAAVQNQLVAVKPLVHLHVASKLLPAAAVTAAAASQRDLVCSKSCSASIVATAAIAVAVQSQHVAVKLLASQLVAAKLLAAESKLLAAVAAVAATEQDIEILWIGSTFLMEFPPST